MTWQLSADVSTGALDVPESRSGRSGRHRRLTLVALVLAVLVTALTSPEARGTSFPAEELVIPWPTGDVHTLEIRTRHAQLVVEQGSNREVRLHAMAPEPRRIEGEGVRLAPIPRIDVSLEEEVMKVRIRGDDKGSRVRVLVPLLPSLRLRASYASIRVFGVGASLEVSTHSGDITIAGAEGLVVADSWSGDVSVAFRRAPPSGAVGFATHGGSIELTFAEVPDATVRFSTRNGSLRSDFPLELLPTEYSREPNTRTSRPPIIARIGAGTLQLWLKTYGGDVHLRRAGNSRSTKEGP